MAGRPESQTEPLAESPGVGAGLPAPAPAPGNTCGGPTAESGVWTPAAGLVLALAARAEYTDQSYYGHLPAKLNLLHPVAGRYIARNERR